MEKLISMTEFVLEQGITETLDTSQIMWYDGEVTKLERMRNYANFLKQPLTLGMFVPAKLVNGVWVVLEEPDYTIYGGNFIHQEDCLEYGKAYGKVLFEGFNVQLIEEWITSIYAKAEPLDLVIQYGKKSKTFFSGMYELKTVEDLVKHNLVLTETARKQIGI